MPRQLTFHRMSDVRVDSILVRIECLLDKLKSGLLSRALYAWGGSGLVALPSAAIPVTRRILIQTIISFLDAYGPDMPEHAVVRAVDVVRWLAMKECRTRSCVSDRSIRRYWSCMCREVETGNGGVPMTFLVRGYRLEICRLPQSDVLVFETTIAS